jgi:predicted ATP-grasp superfamily ATP-dependent carboligase
VDESALANVIEQQLQADHRAGLIRLGDSHGTPALARRLAERIMAAVKVEYELGLGPPVSREAQARITATVPESSDG